jgi:hypothetical protein
VPPEEDGKTPVSPVSDSLGLAVVVVGDSTCDVGE